jgi:putative two-component system response regulator
MKPHVLIVDDAPEIRRLFHAILSPYYCVREAHDSLEALRQVSRGAPDVVLLDLNMPGIDGYEFCRRLKHDPRQRPIHVIVVSAHATAADLQLAFEAGADDFIVKPVYPEELLSRVQLHTRLKKTLQVARDLTDREPSGLVVIPALLERSQEILAKTLLSLAEKRDNDTAQHVLRMRDYAMCLARQLQFDSEYSDAIDEAFLADLHRACPLHDIGKVGIPDEILRKPGRLTPQEFQIMKEHTTMGANILEQAVHQMPNGGFLKMATDIARFHHERWDGQGYPHGIPGSRIPLCARIVAIADVYDALTTERCYKRAWTAAEAKQAIQEGLGSQFDPVIVAAFVNCFDEFVNIQEEYAFEAASEDTHATVRFESLAVG